MILSKNLQNFTPKKFFKLSNFFIQIFKNLQKEPPRKQLEVANPKFKIKINKSLSQCLFKYGEFH